MSAATSPTGPGRRTPGSDPGWREPRPSGQAQPLGATRRPPVGLYIHVPFCVSLCPYCDFVVVAGAAARGPTNQLRALAAALRTELELRADELDHTFGPPGADARPALETVYLGGGTPTLLPSDELAAVLDTVRRRYGIAPGAEFTIEANPGPDERGDPATLAGLGVTRMSFGAQSLDPGELRRLGRRHDARDVGEAVSAARAGGIGSINLDLLYDVPGGSLAGWEATLDAALALRPDHLSLYALTLDDPDAEGLTGPGGDHLPVPSGARRWRASARADQDEDRAAEQYVHAVDRLGAAGWRGYEISNWARPGHESRHNLAYWQRRSVEGVGPGAHGFDGVTRRWNAAHLGRYLAALGVGPDVAGAHGRPVLPPGGEQLVDEQSARSEGVMLALRTDAGVPTTALAEPPLDGVAAWALDSGLLVTAGDRAVLTTRGRLLSNELFRRLI